MGVLRGGAAPLAEAAVAHAAAIAQRAVYASAARALHAADCPASGELPDAPRGPPPRAARTAFAAPSAFSGGDAAGAGDDAAGSSHGAAAKEEHEPPGAEKASHPEDAKGADGKEEHEPPGAEKSSHPEDAKGADGKEEHAPPGAEKSSHPEDAKGGEHGADGKDGGEATGADAAKAHIKLCPEQSICVRKVKATGSDAKKDHEWHYGCPIKRVKDGEIADAKDYVYSEHKKKRYAESCGDKCKCVFPEKPTMVTVVSKGRETVTMDLNEVEAKKGGDDNGKENGTPFEEGANVIPYYPLRMYAAKFGDMMYAVPGKKSVTIGPNAMLPRDQWIAKSKEALPRLQDGLDAMTLKTNQMLDACKKTLVEAEKLKSGEEKAAVFQANAQMSAELLSRYGNFKKECEKMAGILHKLCLPEDKCPPLNCYMDEDEQKVVNDLLLEIEKLRKAKAKAQPQDFKNDDKLPTGKADAAPAAAAPSPTKAAAAPSPTKAAAAPSPTKAAAAPSPTKAAAAPSPTKTSTLQFAPLQACPCSQSSCAVAATGSAALCRPPIIAGGAAGGAHGRCRGPAAAAGAGHTRRKCAAKNQGSDFLDACAAPAQPAAAAPRAWWRSEQPPARRRRCRSWAAAHFV